MSKPLIYWDSCVWIGIINGEADKYPGCMYSFERAEKGEIQILSSLFTIAEVYKTRCSEPYKMLAEEKDIQLEEFFLKDFILQTQVDRKIAIHSRELLRQHHPTLRKAPDAIHLATASLYNAHALYTFDHADLISLNGCIRKQNGETLEICTPPPPPANWRYNTSLLDQITSSESSTPPLSQ